MYVLLQIFEYNEPVVLINGINEKLFFYPELGYDMLDFIELEITEYGIKKNYTSNYYLSKDKNKHIFEAVDDSKEAVKYSANYDTIHPYFSFDLYDSRYDKFNDLNDNKICDFISGKSVVLAHRLLSQFFEICDNREVTYKLFQKFINGRILIPKFSVGYMPVFEEYAIAEFAFNYNDSLAIKTEQITNETDTSSDVVIYYCNNLVDLVFSYTYYLLQKGYTFKKCKNCGKWFVPLHRSDTLYCDRFAPQDKNKTCKQYGTEKAYSNTLKKDEAKRLYRKIYQRKSMLVTRNPDIEKYLHDFNEFKKASKRYKSDIKEGKASNEVYLNWLKKHDISRISKEDKNG